MYSGMPECKLGLNDRVLLEAQGRATKGKAIDLDDIKFHQYVSSFETVIYTHMYFSVSHCFNLQILLSGNFKVVSQATSQTSRMLVYLWVEHSVIRLLVAVDSAAISNGSVPSF